ncbi:MAG: iron chaperone [Chitinophagaceae bacterium]
MEKAIKTNQVQTINEYIAGFPKNVQDILEKLRDTIRKAAPGSEETINYAIPTFTLKGNLVHFAAFKNHIGFYPSPSGIEAFKKELSIYEGAKGSVQFPIDKPLPLSLITKIVKFRVKENLERAKAKKK